MNNWAIEFNNNMIDLAHDCAKWFSWVFLVFAFVAMIIGDSLGRALAYDLIAMGLMASRTLVYHIDPRKDENEDDDI